MLARRRMLAAGGGHAALAAAGQGAAQDRNGTPQQGRRTCRSRAAARSPPEGPGGIFHRRGAGRLALSGHARPRASAAAIVTFEPGARTAWHTHPLGQTLIVTSGCGWVQREGGPKEEIRPGDVVWFPPGEKHWHGATATTAMSHIAIAEALDGKTVDWMEKVSDEQYRAG